MDQKMLEVMIVLLNPIHNHLTYSCVTLWLTCLISLICFTPQWPIRKPVICWHPSQPKCCLLDVLAFTFKRRQFAFSKNVPQSLDITLLRADSSCISKRIRRIDVVMDAAFVSKKELEGQMCDNITNVFITRKLLNYHHQSFQQYRITSVKQTLFDIAVFSKFLIF